MNVLELPIGIDEIEDLGEKTCETRVRDLYTGNIIRQCAKPAAWLYVMRCCGHQAVACEECHTRHAAGKVKMHCLRCDRPFRTLDEGLISWRRI